MMVTSIPRKHYPDSQAGGGGATVFTRREGGAESILKRGERGSASWTPGRILAARLKLQLTQEDFARLIGVTFSTVNRWENGKSAPNRIAIRMLKLAEAEKLKYEPAGLFILPDGTAPPLPEILTLHSAIKWLRERYGMTQEIFANAIGVTFSTVNRWETGNSAPNNVAKRLLRDIARKASAPHELIAVLSA